MEKSFENILSEHRARYPRMESQDCAKLAFQSEFGPAHLIDDPDAAARDLRREWESLSPDATAPRTSGTDSAASI